ncbi:MAG: DUF3868 domain-containing protein [Bacteroides sp.]|nr:DUF3868 domain-containing protein [Bacteroides sp.]
MNIKEIKENKGIIGSWNLEAHAGIREGGKATGRTERQARRGLVPTVLALLALLTAGPSLQAQRVLTREVLRVERHELAKTPDNQVLVSMQIVLDEEFRMSSNRMTTLTPLLYSEDSTRMTAFSPVVVYGRKRQVVQQRDGLVPTDAYRVMRRDNGSRQVIEYNGLLPYETWMEGGYMVLWADLCGCANALQEELRIPLGWMPDKPFPADEHIAYLVPTAPPVKTDSLNGSAYLDFPVNRTEIYPDYRRNPQELAKIHASIDSVRSDRNASIDSIFIKGFASPEGPYDNNVRLADGRAKTLRDYVVRQYALEDVPFGVDSEPEDWAGLRRAVEARDLPFKEQILAIIDSPHYPDPDARNWQLQLVDRGSVYRTLLNDIYPGLRHSDYTIYYSIRDFTVEEAKEIYKTRPWQLSQNEMYRVAQTYEPGSDEYVELFMTAVRQFPTDPTANLNAAAIALRRHDTVVAERYLQHAGQSPQAQCNRGLLKFLQGDLQAAQQLLAEAADAGCQEAQVALKEVKRRIARKAGTN